jgi:hypothetical protein
MPVNLCNDAARQRLVAVLGLALIVRVRPSQWQQRRPDVIVVRVSTRFPDRTCGRDVYWLRGYCATAACRFETTRMSSRPSTDSQGACSAQPSRPQAERRRTARGVNGEPWRSPLVRLVLSTYAEMPGLSLHLQHRRRGIRTRSFRYPRERSASDRCRHRLARSRGGRQSSTLRDSSRVVAPRRAAPCVVRRAGAHSSGHVRTSARPLLVVGAHGPLGSAFVRACVARGIDYVALRHADLTVARTELVDDLVSDLRPWAVVNATGFEGSTMPRMRSPRALRAT